MATNSGITVTGLTEALRDIRAARATVLPALGRALYAEAEPVFDRSQDLVPVDTSALQQSGALHQPVISGNMVSQEISYGDATTAHYAEKVHEDLSVRHMPGRQAKFAEVPFVEGAKGLGERVGARVAREIGG